MRFGRSITYPALALFLLFYSLCAAAWGSRDDDGLSLLWAFGAVRASSNPPRIEPVTTKMVLSSGDKLQMMVQIRKKCFVYFIHRDSHGDFAMIFPYSLKQFDIDYRIGCSYYAPRGKAWFQLDGRTGEEIFYLIASDQRLLDIEYAYDRYAASDEAGKPNLAGQMVSELDKITKITGKYLTSSTKVEKLVEAEAPAPRGFERAEGADPMDVTGLAAEISFKHIYSKTFVIDHR
jgi:hypothetical protein